MEAALKNLAQLKGDNKVLFLGDMFELGKDAAAEHEKIAQIAHHLPFDTIVFLGNNFAQSKTVKKHLHFKDFNALKEEGLPQSIREQLPTAQVLIKGSRGMALERILDLL